MTEPSPPSRPSAVVRSAAKTPVSSELSSPNRKQQLRAAAENWGLNLFSIAREGLTSARAADRYTKLKAGVLALWALLAAAAFVVACPHGFQGENSLGAELTLAGDQDRPVYMIRNGSEDLWEDVTVVVNGDYRLSVARVEPGRDITFGPKQLIGPNGMLAPNSLVITELELRTDDDDVLLVQDGRTR